MFHILRLVRPRPPLLRGSSKQVKEHGMGFPKWIETVQIYLNMEDLMSLNSLHSRIMKKTQVTIIGKVIDLMRTSLPL